MYSDEEGRNFDIGFIAKDVQIKDNIRIIKKLDLVEVSLTPNLQT